MVIKFSSKAVFSLLQSMQLNINPNFVLLQSMQLNINPNFVII